MNLQDAIDRSSSHNEIVSVEYSGTRDELLAALSGLYAGEIDSVNSFGKIYVWGFDASSDDGVMDWRLCVTLVSKGI